MLRAAREKEGGEVAGSGGGRVRVGKKGVGRHNTGHDQFPPFLLSHPLTESVLFPLHTIPSSPLRSCWILFPPLSLIFACWHARSHSLNESLGLPQQAAGLSSSSSFSSSYSSSFCPLSLTSFSSSEATWVWKLVCRIDFRSSDMEVFWARLGKRRLKWFLFFCGGMKSEEKVGAGSGVVLKRGAQLLVMIINSQECHTWRWWGWRDCRVACVPHFGVFNLALGAFLCSWDAFLALGG